MKDYYNILDIPKDADENLIKKAFREKAMYWHPDKNPDENASEKFVLIYEAYEILSDKNKRQRFDELLQRNDDNIDPCFKKWEKQGRDKGEEYARQSFVKFCQIVTKGTRATAHFGCLIYGIIVGFGFVWGATDTLISIIKDMISGEIMNPIGWIISSLFALLCLSIDILVFVVVFSIRKSIS